MLPFVVLGGLTGLDTVSLPQAMISRPIVSATLAGALGGNPVAGLTAGAILELMAIDTLPFGASRYPDWGVAGVVGGALVTLPTNEGAGVTWAKLLMAILAALVTAGLSSWSMVGLRHLNVKALEHYNRGRGSSHNDSQMVSRHARASVISRLHWLGISMDAGRAAIVTALGILIFLPVTKLTVGPEITSASGGLIKTNLSDEKIGMILLALTLAVGLAGVVRLFRGTPRTIWYFGGGLLIASGLLVLR